jgi:hypothetical protein
MSQEKTAAAAAWKSLEKRADFSYLYKVDGDFAETQVGVPMQQRVRLREVSLVAMPPARRPPLIAVAPPRRATTPPPSSALRLATTLDDMTLSPAVDD